MLNIQSRLRTSCWNFIKSTYPMIANAENSGKLQERMQVYRNNGLLFFQAQGIQHWLQRNSEGKQSLQGSLASHLRTLSDLDCSTLEEKANGQLSCRISREFAGRQIQDLVVGGVRLAPLATEQRRRVVVDFSSPNVAKELHVGHLRSTVIGDCLAHVLEYRGHDVIRQNHVGDWGTQFGMLITYLLEENPTLQECDGDVKLSLSLSELQGCYQAAKKRFDESADFKQASLSAVVRLQTEQELEVRLWRMICDVSREAYNDIYRRLNVSTTERGESFYAPFIPEVLAFLEEKGAITVDTLGRRILHPDGHKVPLILVKSDGGYTYAATDIAALWHRTRVLKADWLVYVVDDGQSLHFRTLFAAARQFGVCDSTVRLDHVAFGVVCGEEGKRIKTRSGGSVKLAELLDEAQDRAWALIADRTDYPSEEAKKNVRDTVAYSCARYADLRLPSSSRYIFNFDTMLDMNGDTAVYMMYMLARIRSINKLVSMTDEDVVAEARKQVPVFTDELEVALAQAVLAFAEVIENQAAADLQPYRICTYLCELSNAFTQFYMECYVAESDPATKEVLHVHMNRVVLCKAAADVMTQALALLGINVPKTRL